MRTLTIEIDNDQDIPKLLEFLKPLNMRVKEESETAKRLNLLQQNAGTIKTPWTLGVTDLNRENFYDDITL